MKMSIKYLSRRCFEHSLAISCLAILPWSASGAPTRVIAGNTARSSSVSVLVETDKLHYQASDVIEVSVSNHLDSPVTATDQRFLCTIIALERQSESGEDWDEVRNCMSGAPVQEVTLGPGTTTSVRLELDRVPIDQLTPGKYRVSLAYSLGEHFSLSEEDSHVARSAPFLIE